MNIATTRSAYQVVRANDPEFHFSPDGLSLIGRAALEISCGCPDRYKDIIAECINRGWLKPVAYMRNEEYTWEKLTS